MNYSKKERLKVKTMHWPSPTFSVESNDKWGSRYIWALDEVHKIYEPDFFITFKFGKEESEEIAKFKTKLRQSVSNKHCRHEDFSMAYFGVFEILQDCSVHAHILIRGFSKEYLDDFMSRYNKKYRKTYCMEYCEKTITANGASRYSFKLGYDTKIMFRKNSLSRYTITGGGYFPEGIKHYRDIARRKFFGKTPAIHKNEMQYLNSYQHVSPG